MFIRLRFSIGQTGRLLAVCCIVNEESALWSATRFFTKQIMHPQISGFLEFVTLLISRYSFFWLVLIVFDSKGMVQMPLQSKRYVYSHLKLWGLLLDKETVFYDSKPRVRVDEPQDLSSINSPPVHHGPCSQVRARCGQNSVQLPLLMHIAALCTLRTHQQLHMAVGIISVLCPAWSERNLNPVPKNVTYVVICIQVVFIGGDRLKNLLYGLSRLTCGLSWTLLGFLRCLSEILL